MRLRCECKSGKVIIKRKQKERSEGKKMYTEFWEGRKNDDEKLQVRKKERKNERKKERNNSTHSTHTYIER